MMNVLFIAFPIIYTIYVFHYGIIDFNMTGLINNHETRIFSSILCFIWTIVIVYLLYKLLKKTILIHVKERIIVLLVCMLFTIFLPYDSTGSLLSQLHLFFAIASIIYLHILLYYLKDMNPIITSFYCACLVLSGFFVLTYSSITGISEWIFACGLWVSLYYLYKKYLH